MAAERQRLEERAKAGDERSAALLAKIQSRDEEIRERMDRTRERQEEKQRRVQERIQRTPGSPGRSTAAGRLQPDDVVAAALDLLDETGLDGVTLRDVASPAERPGTRSVLALRQQARHGRRDGPRPAVRLRRRARASRRPGRVAAVAPAGRPRLREAMLARPRRRANRRRQLGSGASSRSPSWSTRSCAVLEARRLRPGDGLGRRPDGDQLHVRRGHRGAGGRAERAGAADQRVRKDRCTSIAPVDRRAAAAIAGGAVRHGAGADPSRSRSASLTAANLCP